MLAPRQPAMYLYEPSRPDAGAPKDIVPLKEVTRMAVLSFLDRERTIAKPGFSRWLVPPAALSIHLAIGQAYAWSVFNLPLSKAIGIDHSAPSDWKLTTIGWAFSIAIV